MYNMGINVTANPYGRPQILKQRVLIALLCACLLPGMLFLSGCFQESTTLGNSKPVDIKGIEHIDIRYSADNIIISQGSTEKLLIKEYFTVDDANYYASTRINGETLAISSGMRPSEGSFSSHVDILLPPSYAGTLTVETKNGMISMTSPQRLSGLTFITDTGAVKMEDIVCESMEIHSNSGRINTENCAGSLAASSKSGSILSYANTGSASFSTVSGRIAASFDSVKGDIHADTKSGKVSVQVPRALGYQLIATTQSGRVTTPLSPDTTVTKTAIITQTNSGGAEETVEVKTLTGSSGVYLRSTISLQSTTGALSLSYS